MRVSFEMGQFLKGPRVGRTSMDRRIVIGILAVTAAIEFPLFRVLQHLPTDVPVEPQGWILLATYLYYPAVLARGVFSLLA